MMKCILVITGLVILSCLNPTSSLSINSNSAINENQTQPRHESYNNDSWEYFLQHLPEKDGEVIDYRGKRVRDGNKAIGIIDYDIGTRDLQQCADAIMRLRAEYLFKLGRINEIAFHFTNGLLYTYAEYLKGMRTVNDSGKIILRKTGTAKQSSHQNLRSYLDIVYAYAGTLSLEKELKKASQPGIGVVIIKGGSPGHCFIIVDEKKLESGKNVYKLVEGYTPAQSIYILRNPENNTEWHTLEKGRPIETASYYFETYKLGKF
jgi:hypothetical protein